MEALKGRESNPLPISTELTHSLPQLLRWMNTCNKDHSECSDEGTRSSTMPTRLLQLDESDSSTISLVNSKDHFRHEAGERYMTLSHCWGTLQLLTLRRANQASLEAGIKVKQLPLSFQHAIQVVRALGIKYLWIDSLW